MKQLLIAFLLLFALGCSKQLSFDELTADLPAEPKVRTFSSKQMHYRISLLDQLEKIEGDYTDTTACETFIDPSFDLGEGPGIITVYKYNSTTTTLTDAWKKLTSKRVKIRDFKIYSEGSTNFLSTPSYYEHSSCTISEKNTESICFLFKGNSSDFYLLSLTVNTDENYPENLKKLLFCAKSIKILP